RDVRSNWGARANCAPAVSFCTRAALALRVWSWEHVASPSGAPGLRVDWPQSVTTLEADTQRDHAERAPGEDRDDEGQARGWNRHCVGGSRSRRMGLGRD